MFRGKALARHVQGPDLCFQQLKKSHTHKKNHVVLISNPVGLSFLKQLTTRLWNNFILDHSSKLYLLTNRHEVRERWLSG